MIRANLALCKNTFRRRFVRSTGTTLRTLAATLTATAALAVTGCNDGTTPDSLDRPPPAATPPTTQTPPPATASRTATVRWMPPTETSSGAELTDLAGYRVYYGQATFRLDRWVTLNSPNETSAVITGLSAGTWYFAVTAFTSQGAESSMSSVVSKRF